MKLNELETKIFEINSKASFNESALRVFKFQFEQNNIYRQFCELVKKSPKNVFIVEHIPFMPISFFKSQQIKTTAFNAEQVFTSSGTSGDLTSKHFVKTLSIYEKSFLKAFDQFYPNWESSVIIGLLPSYLERQGSSLIYMVSKLIDMSDAAESQFALKLTPDLIRFLEDSDKPKILFGVTFALLDLAKQGVHPKNTIVIETGGMKGRGKELTRDELHAVLQRDIKPDAIHSEYGMTELLSQAYLQGDYFTAPNWMRVLVREPADPFCVKNVGRGALNIIDLANLYSCSFIASDDLGTVHSNGKFEVLGRMDHAQIRGCNLLLY